MKNESKKFKIIAGKNQPIVMREQGKKEEKKLTQRKQGQVGQ